MKRRDKIIITQMPHGKYKVEFRALGEDVEGELESLAKAIEAVSARYYRVLRRIEVGRAKK